MQKTERPGDIAKHLAEGEAALVLLESLLLTLVGKGILTADEVVNAVETVVDVKLQLAADGSSPELSRIAAGILVKVANSMSAAETPSSRRVTDGGHHGGDAIGRRDT